MNLKPVLFTILVGLSLTGVAASLVYYLFRKEDEELDNLIEGIQTSRPGLIEVKIPKDCVGIVIGRGGRNIKDIQEKSDARINFKQDFGESTYRECVIRGTPESTQLAETLIYELITNQPLMETSEMWVPQRACGRIIGRNGDNIRSISRASSAKITVESDGISRDPCAQHRVTIVGTMEQIELAKALIQEKVDEDNDLRKNLEESLASRSPRKKDRLCITAGEDYENTEGRSFREHLQATGSDSLMEVYVSGLKTPSCFWLQVKGPQSVELDHLVEHMTDYYQNEENQKLHAIRELVIGQVVAAPTEFDSNWYRAEVTGLSDDDYDPQESLISLLYLDYGDLGSIPRKNIMELRTDFLRLRFQAIECALAKVLPSGSDWSEEAIQLFDDLTHVAQWVSLMARVDSCRERPKNREGCVRREGSPIPCVDLYDTKDSCDISVAEELVKQGFAVWEKSPSVSSKSSVGVKPNSPSISPKTGPISLSELHSPVHIGQGDAPLKQRVTVNDPNSCSATNGHRPLDKLLLENSSLSDKKTGLSRGPILKPDTDDESSDELEMY